MTRTIVGLVVAGTLVSANAVLLAQEKSPPSKYVNLQVFPKDTSPEVLTAAMKNFTRALGVRCPYCHVGEEGMPLEKFDFAADTVPNKQVARMMMRMSGEINGQITKSLPDAAAKGMQVTCWTCHRGSAHPQHTPDAVKPPGR